MDKKVQKIKHLLAKAGSTDSAAEAEALFVKAQELMVRWRIQESELEDKKSTMAHNDIPCFEFSLEGQWERILARVVFWTNGCHFSWDNYHKIITIYGTDQDVCLVKHLFTSARDTFRRLSRDSYNEAKKKAMVDHNIKDIKILERQGHLAYRSVYIRSFLTGCCEGLGHSIKRMTKEVVQNYDPANKYSVILADKTKLAAQYMHSEFDVAEVGTLHTGATGDAAARMKGVDAGLNHKMFIPVETTQTGATGVMLGDVDK